MNELDEWILKSLESHPEPYLGTKDCPPFTLCSLSANGSTADSPSLVNCGQAGATELSRGRVTVALCLQLTAQPSLPG